LPVTHVWTRKFPDYCSLDGFSIDGEWLIIKLYCVDKMIEYRINSISGKTSINTLDEVELRGAVERRREFITFQCFKGYKKKVWGKIVRGLDAKMECRKDICVAAILSPNYTLEIQVYSVHGDILETIGLGKVFSFDIAATENIITVTTHGFTEDNTASVIFDASTGAIIDELSRFGGYLVSSPDIIFIISEQEGKLYCRGYNNDGEEVISDEGVPLFIPFNPIPHRIPGMDRFSSKQVAVMDRNEIRVYNLIDYSIDYTVTRPPFTRGVYNINPDDLSVTALSVIMGMPVIANYDFRGGIRWSSHIIGNIYYALVASDIVAVHEQMKRNTVTRLYKIKDGYLLQEEVFGPNVMPIIARKSYILLTDGRLVASYMLE